MSVSIAPWYRAHEKQHRVHSSPARFRVIGSGVRGGKSLSATVEFARSIYRDLAAGKAREVRGEGKRRSPALLYWIVSPTAPLTRIPVRYLLDAIPRELIDRVYESENSIWLKPNILVEIKTAERPDLLVASGVDGMLIDEACRVKESAWKGALRSRLSDRLGWAILASSPLGKTNWVWRELIQNAGLDNGVVQPGDRDIESIHWVTADNPFIERSEIESARRMLPASFFARDYEASWDSFGGGVFTEFTDAHVLSERELILEYGLGGRPITSLFRRVLAGVDFGWSVPGAIVVVGELSDSQYIVLDESYTAQRVIFDPRVTSGTWITEAARLKAKWGISQFYADPARPDAIFDISRSGLPVSGADNDLYLGVRKMVELMHPVAEMPSSRAKPSLRILDTCPNLIREIRAYQWSEDKARTGYTDVPAPNQSDHAVDALRYGLTELVRYAKVHPEEHRHPWLKPKPRGPIG